VFRRRDFEVLGHDLFCPECVKLDFVLNVWILLSADSGSVSLAGRFLIVLYCLEI
jgi:hypothetical protein